eukprot:m.194323 g.194323  ORF g.194323 m.194323 type:complete len:109 (-) comp10614_c1_seq4:866-1192(-)
MYCNALSSSFSCSIVVVLLLPVRPEGCVALVDGHRREKHGRGAARRQIGRYVALELALGALQLAQQFISQLARLDADEIGGNLWLFALDFVIVLRAASLTKAPIFAEV